MKNSYKFAFLFLLFGSVANASTWFVELSKLEVYSPGNLGGAAVYSYGVNSAGNKDGGAAGAQTGTGRNNQNMIYDDVTGRISWIGTITNTLTAGALNLVWTDGAFQVQAGYLTRGSMVCQETDPDIPSCDPDRGGITSAMFNFNGAAAVIPSPAINALIVLQTTDINGNTIANMVDLYGDLDQADITDMNYYHRMTFKILASADGLTGAEPLVDTDADGISDSSDNCSSVSNADQLNFDNDEYGNACDENDDNDADTDAQEAVCGSDPLNASSYCSLVAVDSDGDGIADLTDNCPSVINADQANTDGDSQGNACDDSPNGPDSDGDGIADTSDNCSGISNGDQLNTDGDNQGDACDSTPNGDTDADGVDNNADNCPTLANTDQKDYDADGQGNLCDSTPNVVVTIQSSGTQDGWLLESKETTSKGGKADVSGSTLIIGDSALNQEYRSVLHFNTATLPDNAVITKATLTLKKQSLKGDVKPLGNILVDLKQKNFGTSASLAIADFEAAPGNKSVATLKASGSSYTGGLSAAGLANISKIFATQFKVHFTKDDNNDKGDDYLKFYSGNGSASLRPVLQIEYYVP